MFEQFIDERLIQFERNGELSDEFDTACADARAVNADPTIIEQAGFSPTTPSSEEAAVALKQRVAQLSTGLGSFSAAAGLKIKKSWKTYDLQ